MSGERVLVVDDDPDVVELCRRILTSEGYLVKGATSGQEALEMARREPFDLLLVDIRMPDMDGMEVYRSIRVIAPEVAGVIITAYGSLDVAIEAIELGFSGFVAKPFSSEALALAVGQALERRRLERENARLRALIPLFELSRAFMGITELDGLLNRVVQVAREETGADRASLMLLGDDGLTIEAAAGLGRRLEAEEALAALAVERGEALLLDKDSPFDPRLRKAMGGEVSSALCVPLKAKGRVIGVLNLTKLGGPPFSEVDMELVSILCGQAAIAIENVRLYATQKQRAQEMGMLLDIAKVTTSTLHMTKVLKLLAQRAARACGADRCTILLLDEKGKTLTPAMSQFASGRKDKRMWRLFKDISYPRPVAEVPEAQQVLQEGRPLFIPDALASSLPRYWIEPFNVKSLLVVPLISKGRPIGVMGLDHIEEGKGFTAEQVRLALTIGAQAAIAIENAKLFEETRQRAIQLQTIEEVGRKASSILDLDELLPYAARAIQESFGYYHVDIFLVDQATGYAVFKASNDPAGGKVWKEQGLRFKVGEEGMIGWVAHTGEPLLANDVSQEPHYLPDELLPETKSELVVPLKVGERVVGVLDVNGDKLNAFDEKDMFILQTLAGQLAIAIENARLYAEVNRLAITDALTGLYNRRWFDIQLDKEFNRATRYGHPLSLAIVEVDHLKKINDTWGHQVGDLVLQTIARVLKANSRQMDVICRYGGDEITIILPETDKEGALGVGERLRALIEAAPIEGKEGQRMEGVSVTISLGVATYPTDAADKEELIRHADQACYLAKQLGRNRVCSWSECSAAEQG